MRAESIYHSVAYLSLRAPCSRAAGPRAVARRGTAWFAEGQRLGVALRAIMPPAHQLLRHKIGIVEAGRPKQRMLSPIVIGAAVAVLIVIVILVMSSGFKAPSAAELAALDGAGFGKIVSKLSDQQVLDTTTVLNMYARFPYNTQTQIQAMTLAFFETLGFVATNNVMASFLQATGSSVAKVAWIDSSMINTTVCDWIEADTYGVYAADVQAAFMARCAAKFPEQNYQT